MKRSLKKPQPKRSLSKRGTEQPAPSSTRTLTSARSTPTDSKPKRSLKKVEAKVEPPKPPPPLPKLIRGTADPKMPGMKLVPLAKAPDHPVFPRLNKAVTLPGTHYRFDPKSKVVTTLVTIMPDGLHVAHFTCRACAALDVNMCRCSNGLSTSRSVEYIYDQIVAELAGEEWTIHHPNYKGSLRANQTASTGPKWVSPPPMSPKPSTAPPTGAGKRSLARHAPAEPFDLKKTDEAAVKQADALTRSMTRKLDKPKKRSLKKSEATPKRTLKRK